MHRGQINIISWIGRLTWAVALLLLAACTSTPARQTTQSAATATAAVTQTSPAPTRVESPTAAQLTAESRPTAAAAMTASPTLDPNHFTNPVLDRDFPDPDTLKVGDTWYAYATNTNEVNIPVARSKDLVHWEMLGDALPQLPAWAAQEFGWAWAPEVNQPADGAGYLMYFVARYPIGKGGMQCIGIAESERAEGPFRSTGREPFICQTEAGGSIDPSLFIDEDGKRYILWKNDGNLTGGQAWLYIQPISADGRTLQGSPTRLLTADQAWEGVLVEAPTLWKHVGKYFLFYSANAFNSPRYAVGVAAADTILGPYTKEAQPVLKTDMGAGLVGPGGQDIVIGPHGGEWVLFHGWAGEGYRRLYLAPLVWKNGAPVIQLHGRDPLPLP